MTDFYSVLKASINKRDLRSPAARHDVYDQAREAMIRRLWSFDPPLSEDEIDSRIGLFDAAVEKIENDLEEAYDATETNNRRPDPQHNTREQQAVQQSRPPLVYEGYDEEADYAPAVGERSVRPRYETPAPPVAYRSSNDELAAARRRQAARQEISARPRRVNRYDERLATIQERETRDDTWQTGGAYDPEIAEIQPRSYQEPEYERIQEPEYELTDRERRHDRGDARYDSVYEEPAPDDESSWGEPDQVPAAVDAVTVDPQYGEFADQDAAYDEPVFEDDPYQQYPLTESRGYESADQSPDELYYTRPTQRGRARRETTRWREDIPNEPNDANDFEPPRQRHPASGRRSDKRPHREHKAQQAKGGSKSVRILAISVAALSAILIAFNAYVFLPILFGSDQPRSSTVSSPSKSDDRLPEFEAATGSATRIVSDSATAMEIPERNLDVTESLVIFDGSDPTVFEGSSNNPIQFDSDSEGGFARISSTASAAGARAIIGPGLAERLAGHNIRVTLLARSSSENGAATMRFAYQSGLAVSYWQSADLSRNYGTYGMIWRVPAADTAAGDYLLIEPGIPGDGTSTDIRMIKIDILAS